MRVRGRILLAISVALLAVFAYDGVFRLLLLGVVRLPKLPNELSTVTLMLAIFSVAHAWYSLGGRLTATFFALSAAISWLYEEVGVATGLIFGAYHYTDYLGAKLGSVPLLIPLAWFMMIYPSYAIANLALSGRHSGTRPGVSWLVALSATSAVVMTAWDLVVDPILSGPKAHAWIWENGGQYFGIPIQNYFGWLLTTFTVYFAYRAVEQRRRLAPAGPAGGFVAALPVAAYGLMLLSNLLSGAEPDGVMVVGPIAMGIPIAAALAGWTLRRNRPAPRLEALPV